MGEVREVRDEAPAVVEDEVDECRICRGGAEPNRPLFYPCLCSGSIRYTHEDCLVRWLSQSGSNRCELCNHVFRFEPQYSPDAPGTLSTTELILGLAGRAKRTLLSALRILLVLTVWMFLLPVGTCWTWHALFLESPKEILPFFANRGLTGIPTDAFYGCLLSAGIVLVFLGVTSLREYLRNTPDVVVDQIMEGVQHRMVGGETVDHRGVEAVDDDDDPFAPYAIDNHQQALGGDDGVDDGNDNAGGEEDLDFLALFDFDAEEAALEEVIGLRGPIRILFDNAGTVLVTNAIFLGIFALIPLLVGRLTQRISNIRGLDDIISRPVAHNDTKIATDGSQPTTEHVEMGSTVTILIGYGVISLVASFGVMATSLLRSHYPRFNTPLARQMMVFLRYTATFIKVGILVIFEFGLFPLGCGWWLDACTVRFFDSSFNARREFFVDSPWTSTIVHGLVGIVYMINVSLFVALLREVLRPEVLWFLRSPDDPDFHPFQEIVEKPLSRHARRICLSVLIYAPLIVLFVSSDNMRKRIDVKIFVPLEACVASLPSVFPLRLHLTLTGVPTHKLLMHVCFVCFLPLANSVRYAQPRVLLRKFLFTWVNFFGGQLGIKKYVLKDVHRDADLDDTSADSGTPLEGLMFLAWMTLVLITCVFLTLPTIIGRRIFDMLGLSLSNDVYTIGLGVYLIWAGTEAFMRLAHFVSQHRFVEALRLCVSWTVFSLENAILGILWFGVIPLLAGLFVEKTWWIHFRNPEKEFSLYILYQDWTVGVLVHRFWIRLVLSGLFDTPWHELLERNRGFARIETEFIRTLRTVVFPVIFQWLILLIGPYVAAKLGIYVADASKEASEFALKYAHLFSMMVYANLLLLEYMRRLAERLHDSIRDDRYLVGRQLYNYVVDGGGANPLDDGEQIDTTTDRRQTQQTTEQTTEVH